MAEFMVPDIDKGKWYSVESHSDTVFVLAEYLNDVIQNHLDYLESNDSIEVVYLGNGYGSRLSAPGYLDCTDWNAPFDTELDAMAALYDLYADIGETFEQWLAKYSLSLI